jgi:hypothetical protein
MCRALDSTQESRGANIWQAHVWTPSSPSRSSSRFLPAALELSLTATEQVEQERAELDRHGPHRRERAAYEVERAARKSHAVEPEHRLVARTLERTWEEKLVTQQPLEEEYHRFLQQKPRRLLTRPNERLFAAWRRIFPGFGLLQPPPLPIAKRSCARLLNGSLWTYKGTASV